MPWRSIQILLLCTFFGVAGGAIVGLLLGKMAPAFCFEILRVEPALRIEGAAREIGLGLGVANGIPIGLVAGIVCVIAEAIKTSRKPTA